MSDRIPKRTERKALARSNHGARYDGVLSLLVADHWIETKALVGRTTDRRSVEHGIRPRHGPSRMADPADQSFSALSRRKRVGYSGADLDRSAARESRAAVHH